MTGPIIDTFLKVLDSDNDLLQTDDDGGPLDDTDSRLDITLNAGTYSIIATSYAANETGSYTISVAVNPGT
jgi:hypothetical protein